MSKRTEIPWKLVKQENDNGNEIYPVNYKGTVNSANRALIAQVSGWGNGMHDETEGEAQANADFIVRACNSHDELVAACKLALEEFPSMIAGLHPENIALVALKQALARQG